MPTAGHLALAGLCAHSRVQLVVTTNFDRLIERALDTVRITPQVISSASAIAGMTPLIHTPVTALKFHEDYATTGLRNTASGNAAARSSDRATARATATEGAE